MQPWRRSSWQSRFRAASVEKNKNDFPIFPVCFDKNLLLPFGPCGHVIIRFIMEMFTPNDVVFS